VSTAEQTCLPITVHYEEQQLLKHCNEQNSRSINAKKQLITRGTKSTTKSKRLEFRWRLMNAALLNAMPHLWLQGKIYEHQTMWTY